MTRALRIDLRRSSAVGIGLLLLALGLATLLLLSEAEWWVGRWTKLAVEGRSQLMLLWPLTLAAGAWQVGRDRRGRVGELFASTGRPKWQRVTPPAVALLLTVSVAYLLVLAAGLPRVLPSARYFNPAAVGIVAVGLMALIAAALLGMAVGRLLPSRFTAPALAIAGLGVMIAPSLNPSLGGRSGRAFEALTPELPFLSSDFSIVSSRVNATQGIWMLAVAATAFLLLAAASSRQRIIAVLPALMGAAVVIPMLPHGPWHMVAYVPDAGAQALVCAEGAPRVCVRQVHAGLLPEVVGPARDALQRLSRLPEPPTSAVEGLDEVDPLQAPAPEPSTVAFSIDMNGDGRLEDPLDLQVRLLDVAAHSACPDDWSGGPHNDAARRAAAFLLLGRAPVASHSPTTDLFVADAYRTVSALPEKARVQRLSAARTAYLTCTGDPYAALTGAAT
jgi:hypothetical protein